MEITVEQMMTIENNGHAMGFLKKFMMENAGSSVIRILRDTIPLLQTKKCIIYAGLGNNGGDGLVMARHLAGYGADVSVILLGDEEKIKTEESRWNWNLLKKMPSVKLSINPKEFDNKADIIIDGILGTGIRGEIREPYASAINTINNSGSYIVSVDVPSGLDPDTGETSNLCVKADITVTFHKMKVGMPKAKSFCGNIFVEKIGIPPEAEVGVL